MKWPYISYAAAWLATGLAVCIAIIITRRISPMWFFLLPMLMYIGGPKPKEDDQNGETDTGND